MKCDGMKIWYMVYEIPSWGSMTLKNIASFSSRWNQMQWETTSVLWWRYRTILDYDLKIPKYLLVVVMVVCVWERERERARESVQGWAKMLTFVQLLSHVWLALTPWTVAQQTSQCSPGKNTGVGCHFLLQGIFLDQGSKPPTLAGWFFNSEPLRKPYANFFFFFLSRSVMSDS